MLVTSRAAVIDHLVHGAPFPASPTALLTNAVRSKLPIRGLGLEISLPCLDVLLEEPSLATVVTG